MDSDGWGCQNNLIQARSEVVHCLCRTRVSRKITCSGRIVSCYGTGIYIDGVSTSSIVRCPIFSLNFSSNLDHSVSERDTGRLNPSFQSFLGFLEDSTMYRNPGTNRRKILRKLREPRKTGGSQENLKKIWKIRKALGKPGEN